MHGVRGWLGMTLGTAAGGMDEKEGSDGGEEEWSMITEHWSRGTRRRRRCMRICGLGVYRIHVRVASCRFCRAC